MLRHAVRLNSLTELAVTKLDVLDGFDTVKVCTGYRIGGRHAAGLPRSRRRPRRGRAGVRDAAGLGHRASATCASRPACRPAPGSCIELIEQQVGVPVRVVGVGAERDDYLIWQ